MHHLKPLSELKLEYCPETLNSGQNRRFIVPCDLEIWRMTLKNNRVPLLCCFKLCASFHSHRWIQTKVTVRKRSIWVQIGDLLSRVTSKIWRMTLKNNRVPILCCFKLCASFHSHRWIQTKVTVRKRSIQVQIGDLLSSVTLKFDGWLWKTIGHLFYVASSFMHHFIVIGEFKLKLQSGNAQFGSKSTIFLAVWPWNLMDNFKNNRAPLLSNIKLYASFHHHMWIQTGVMVRKRLNGVMTSVTLTFDLWPWPFAWTSLLSLGQTDRRK